MVARDALHQQIRLEVTQAYYQIADLAERVKAADQQQKAAEDALTLAQARYQVQLGSFLDVLTAQTAAASAEANYARTQFDYERAKSQFDFATGAQIQPSRTGKILVVERHEPETLCCYSGTDTPLPSNVEEYDISVQVGDTTYVARYQAATGYVPVTWVKDHLVDVRIDKHSVYLRTPAGEELRLPIVSRKPADQVRKD